MQDARRNPAETAREVLRQLAQQRMPLTPENYARAYAKQEGVPLAELIPALGVLDHLARTLLADMPKAAFAAELRAALRDEQWMVVQRILKAQLQKVSTASAATSEPAPAKPSRAVVALDSAHVLKELLAKTIDFLVDERLGYTAEVVRDARALADTVKGAMSQAEVESAANRLRHFWLGLELRGEGPEPMIRGLHELLRMMVRNMGDLVVDDQWVQGQVERIQGLLDQPLSPRALQETQRGYREFVFRQGTVKHAMDEATQAIRALTATLIDRLGKVAESTGAFSGSMESYARQIRSADGLPQISDVLERLIGETQSMHTEMRTTHQELSGSRDRILDYEAHVRALQAELSQMSELIREDALTGALNRRGLEKQYEAEESRADRKASPMCLAVLDIDNFKELNDRLGHVVGDDSLKHLARVVRETLRPSDSLARYGGEEFVILLPDTSPDEAEKVMIRVQRELTRRYFMHNNERVLITFSAGIAQRQPGEAQESVIARADTAMYHAKRAGKNRVHSADGSPT